MNVDQLEKMLAYVSQGCRALVVDPGARFEYELWCDLRVSIRKELEALRARGLESWSV
jgi:hypothetical protein